MDTLLIKPVNGFVYHPVRQRYLPEVVQEVPRDPYWLNQLRMGDVIEVAPEKKAKPEAPAATDKKTPAAKSDAKA